MTESPSSILSSSVFGVLRGIAVHTLIYPLESLKVIKQASLGKKSLADIVREKGFFSLYEGLSPQLIKTGVKQIWVWPLITHLPSYFPNSAAQVATGLSIATVDACISTPLERLKMQSILHGNLSIKRMSWDGFWPHFFKLSMNWTSFLVAENYFRSQDNHESASSLALTIRGVKVACVVALTSAPFDFVHTLRQNGSLKNFSLRHIYLGSPLNLLSLIIHNIASVALMEYLWNLKNNPSKS